MSVCRVVAIVLAIGAALLGNAVNKAGGADQAFYQLLPHMPAEYFGAIGSVAIRVLTCEAKPVISAARAVGLMPPQLDCGVDATKQLRVAASTVKGGSIMFARLLADVSLHCGYCVGYGFRPSGAWPPPAETVPSYDADSLLAIALVKGWQEYAVTQVPKENVRCSISVREPLARLTSMLLYFEAAGEYDLRAVSATMKSLPSVEERVAWVWGSIGRETMTDTHQYLMDSIRFGCRRAHMEHFRADFNGTVRAVLSNWRIAGSAHDALVAKVQKASLKPQPQHRQPPNRS
jgi:hypothetical protein